MGIFENYFYSKINKWMAKKDAMTGSYSFLIGMPTGQGTPERYNAYVENFYKKNSVCYSCQQRIIKAFNTAELMIAKKSNPKEEFKNAEAAALIVQPSEDMTLYDFNEQWLLFLFTGGANFMHQLTPKHKYENWRPDKVTPKTNKQGEITSYKVEGIGEPFPPEEVIFTRFINPDGTLKGVSPNTPSAIQADSYNAASQHNFATLDNGAQIPGVLSVNVKGFTKDQKKEVEETFREKFEGPTNAGRTMIVGGGTVEYTPITHNQKEFNWLEGKNQDADAICAAWGVPPELVNREPKYANFSEARTALYIDTVIPLINKYIGAFNQAVAKIDKSLVVSIRKIPEIEAQKRRERREEITAAVASVQNAIMTPDEARVDIGKEATGLPAMRKHYIGGGLVPITGEIDLEE